MALDLTPIDVGDMADAAELTRLFDNEKKIKGTATAQTEIVGHALLSIVQFRGGVSGRVEVVKRYRPEDAVARFGLKTVVASSPSVEVPVGGGVMLEQGIVEAGDDETQQVLSKHRWRLEPDDAGDPRRGVFELTAIGTTTGPNIVIDSAANMAIGIPVATEKLDLGTGVNKLNVNGDYKIDGVVQNDWTLNLGSPDTAEWDEHALVSGFWQSLYHVVEEVGCATTANIVLTDAQTVDTVTANTGVRVLVKNQTITQENGIYDAKTVGAWTRVADCDTWEKLKGAAVSVTAGAVHGGQNWAAKTGLSGIIDVTPYTWFQDTRTTFGSPTDFLSDTECPGVDAEFLQGSPWITPFRYMLPGTDYTGSDTTIGVAQSVAIGVYDYYCVVTIVPDVAAVGNEITAKLKNTAGTVLDTVTITAKVSTVDGITNSVPETVLLMATYEAVAADTVKATVSGTGGGNAEGVLIPLWLGVVP